MRIALAQINLTVGSIESNADQIIASAKHARDKLKADLVIFPELSITGYPPEDLLYRTHLYDRVNAALTSIINSVDGIDLLIGFPEKTDNGIYNAATLTRDGKRLITYHKQQLPNYSVFDERRHFTAGNSSAVIERLGIFIGVCICEDIWHTDPIKSSKHDGAELIVALNASPFRQGKSHAREMTLQKRANENAIPLIYCNLVGGQDELVFDGGSMAVDASGAIVAHAPFFQDSLFCVDIKRQESTLLLTPSLSDTMTTHPRNQTLHTHNLPLISTTSNEEKEKDNNVPLPDSTSLDNESNDLALTYEALVLGVRDYVTKNHFKQVVIGLSGGIDSALTLAIAVDALGAEAVTAVMMPSEYTSEQSITDAQQQAHHLGVTFEQIPIKDIFNCMQKALATTFLGFEKDATEENLQARIRGTLLMAISNKKRAMVLSTGNKSELSVGYCTLYGDMAGGFCVLKDVYKTRVYELADFRNNINQIIPNTVINKPPSAELAPNQKDTDTLPPYSILDAILSMYIDEEKSTHDIINAGFEEELVTSITKMVKQNEYKRRQAPPGVRISNKAFGRDRRYPITSGY